jgi:acylglycerol lipase
MMLCCETITTRLSDGYEGLARLWLPESPRGGVLYLHGIQSHGLWFERSARRLAEAGLAVLLPDRRGSGRNDADRGHTPNARRLLRDCSEYLDELHVRSDLDRFHVAGVSWGGKLALGMVRYAPQRVDRVALIAPGLFSLVDLPVMEKLRVGLAALAGGRRLFDIPLDSPELFTGNPERQQFIRDDPLRLRQVTAGFLIASRRLDRYALGARKLKEGRPLRVFLAAHDRIIDNARTREFVRRISWPERQIVEYPGTHHTLEFEPDPEPFLRDLVEWMTAKT